MRGLFFFEKLLKMSYFSVATCCNICYNIIKERG
nr:MAG TPA: hypothetical protein [Caudoviricetes sp.]